jgi:transcriptional regulator with PAS, ATPase and Fis domain
MKNDMSDLKKLVLDMMHKGADSREVREENAQLIKKLIHKEEEIEHSEPSFHFSRPNEDDIMDTEEIVEESLSLEDKEIELIKKALDKHHGKRKNAAVELGISERTLYRKIKEYNIQE